MELNEFTIGLAGLAFIAGTVLGWLLKKPSPVMVESPDRQREKTLFVAQHEALRLDMQSHLETTSTVLQELAERQKVFADALKGEQHINQSSGTELSELPAKPARDYSDTRGQLDS